MPAMHDDVLCQMNAALVRKRDLMLRLLPFSMSHEECIRLIAPSDHVSILTDAAKYASNVASEQWIDVEVPGEIDGTKRQKVQLMMRTHASKQPPLTPRYPYWQYFEPGGAKVTEWLTKRYEIGRRFGAASHVLYNLNMMCDTGQQLRFMWPAVMHLCTTGISPRMDRWIAKYSAFKPCKHMPAVPQHLKAAIQDANALLTSCALIGDDVEAQPDGEVLIAGYGDSYFPLGPANVKRL